MHPLGKRPISFSKPGIECNEHVTLRRIREKIIYSQLEWDSVYDRLPFISRLLCSICGDVTEPVHTSEGVPIDIIVDECLKNRRI